jgi:hypothetical protein
MQKRTVKILTRIAIVLIVLGLIYAIAVSVSSSKLRQAYTDLKKDGRPMESSDVIPPEIPDTENAALLYESAALLLKAQPAAGDNLLEDLGDLSDKFIKESLDPDKLVDFKEMIGQEVVTQALSIVEQGTRRDSCRFDLNYDDGLNTLLTHLSDLRNLTRILCAKAYLEAKIGNPDTAWDMVLTQVKFADALRTEPVLISKLRRIAMIRLSCETITKLCEIAPPNAQQSSDIQSLLKDLDDIRPLIHSIDAERLLIGEWVFNLSKDEMYKTSLQHGSKNDTGLLHKLIISGITFKPLLLADHAAYLRFMHDGTRFLERPFSAEKGEVLKEGIQKTRYLVTRILTPAVFRIKEIHFEMIAQLRIAQAGLALLQHKQNEDTFPATLEALKLPNINDPFSDETLLYKTEGQGFVLYSVGPDQANNEGSPRQKKQEKDWDIVWQFSDKD